MSESDVDTGDFARSLTSLSEEEQAAVDAARAPQTTAPEAANAADDQLKLGSFIVDSGVFCVSTENGTAGEAHAKPFVYFAKTTESDKIRAANDDWASGTAYSMFETDAIKDIMNEHAMKIHSKTDDVGRTFFHFDNGVNISLAVVVFDMKGVKMVKLQNTILSLDTLLSLKRCVNLPETEEKGKQLTIRTSPTFQGGVECTFHDDVTLTIPGISVDSVMIIVSHLSQVFVTEEDESESDVDAEEESESDMDTEEPQIITHSVAVQQKPETAEETGDSLFLLGICVIMSGLSFSLGHFSGLKVCGV